jgi:hypothetical protein
MKKRLLGKNIVVLLMVLILVAAFCNNVSSISVKKNNLLLGRSWSENFDSYTLGQYLDGSPDDGGWKGWENNTAYGAFVSDIYSQSSPHSVEIEDTSDLVHEYNGYTSGKWRYTAWQYIPEDFTGETGFMLLNKYSDAGDNSWSTQLRFSSLTQVVHSDTDGSELPLIIGQWVEIRVDIDIDSDVQKIYYGGDFLVEKSWKDGVTGGGDPNIGAVDLFANSASAIYYDDFSLEEYLSPDLRCSGEIRAEDVTPGSTVTGSFTVENDGDGGSILDWEVSEYPEWGSDWTCTPSSGTGLTPEAGAVTVEVSFTAPSESETEFPGEIKVVNSNDPSDSCNIEVYIITPRIKTANFQLLHTLSECFPNIAQLINHLLGLVYY